MANCAVACWTIWKSITVSTANSSECARRASTSAGTWPTCPKQHSFCRVSTPSATPAIKPAPSSNGLIGTPLTSRLRPRRPGPEPLRATNSTTKDHEQNQSPGAMRARSTRSLLSGLGRFRAARHAGHGYRLRRAPRIADCARALRGQSIQSGSDAGDHPQHLAQETTGSQSATLIPTLEVTPMKIQTALLSVSDKTGIVDFALALSQRGVLVLSSGVTTKLLDEACLPVTEVASHSGSPEIPAGRVKTLHPKIHGGLLA